MRTLILFLLIIVACARAIEDDEVLKQWAEFQTKFGKTYKSPVESRKRLNIFKQNLLLIEAHNELFEEGKVSHTLGINHFADWTNDEFSQYINKGLINKPKRVGSNHIIKTSKKLDLPEAIDWREAGLVTEVKDQMDCGSCWAFSATGSIEGQFAKQNGTLVSLSEQSLVDCSASYLNFGCNGGLTTQAFDYIIVEGIERESDYPYTGHYGECKAESSKVITKISSYVEIDDEEELVEAIATIGPISTVMHATDKLHFYSSGIFDDVKCKPYDFNHGILVVGYGKEDGKEFYIIKNSWGADWGEDGYLRLLKGDNKCGIAALPSYPLM